MPHHPPGKSVLLRLVCRIVYLFGRIFLEKCCPGGVSSVPLFLYLLGAGRVSLPASIFTDDPFVADYAKLVGVLHGIRVVASRCPKPARKLAVRDFHGYEKGSSCDCLLADQLAGGLKTIKHSVCIQWITPL